MGSTTANVVHPVVAGLRAVADALATLPVWQLSGVEQAELLADVESERRRIDYGMLRVLADVDDRKVAVEQAGVSTLEFLRRRLRISPSEAKARLRASQELIESVNPSGEPIPAALPRTADGVAAGAISLEQVRVIGRTMDKLPTGLDPTVRDEAETELATHAESLDPTQLAVVARRIHAILDPDGALDETGRRGGSWRSSVMRVGATWCGADSMPRARR